MSYLLNVKRFELYMDLALYKINILLLLLIRYDDIEKKKKTTHNHLKLFEDCVVRDSGLFRRGTVCL